MTHDRPIGLTGALGRTSEQRMGAQDRGGEASAADTGQHTLTRAQATAKCALRSSLFPLRHALDDPDKCSIATSPRVELARNSNHSPEGCPIAEILSPSARSLHRRHLPHPCSRVRDRIRPGHCAGLTVDLIGRINFLSGHASLPVIPAASQQCYSNQVPLPPVTARLPSAGPRAASSQSDA